LLNCCFSFSSRAQYNVMLQCDWDTPNWPSRRLLSSVFVFCSALYSGSVFSTFSSSVVLSLFSCSLRPSYHLSLAIRSVLSGTIHATWLLYPVTCDMWNYRPVLYSAILFTCVWEAFDLNPNRATSLHKFSDDFPCTPLWSSYQSSWLQIRRSGQYQKEVVGLERGPLSLVSTTEELLDRKVSAPV
jgi:hypothetical protein